MRFPYGAQLLVRDSRLFAGAIQTAPPPSMPRALATASEFKGGGANEFISLKWYTQCYKEEGGGAVKRGGG